MDALTAVVVLVPTVINLGIAIARIVIDYKKSKKDEIWETVARLMCAGKDDAITDEPNFEDFYAALKKFKESGCATPENRLDPDSPRQKK